MFWVLNSTLAMKVKSKTCCVPDCNEIKMIVISAVWKVLLDVQIFFHLQWQKFSNHWRHCNCVSDISVLPLWISWKVWTAFAYFCTENKFWNWNACFSKIVLTETVAPPGYWSAAGRSRTAFPLWSLTKLFLDLSYVMKSHFQHNYFSHTLCFSCSVWVKPLLNSNVI